MLKTKRVYEKAEPGDGKRILVDRLWPRGIKKTEAGIDEWVKELGPSTELRKWFSHDPQKWPEFEKKYKKELSEPHRAELLENIVNTARSTDITLVYTARDKEHNNAIVLEKIIHEKMKHFNMK